MEEKVQHCLAYPRSRLHFSPLGFFGTTWPSSRHWCRLAGSLSHKLIGGVGVNELAHMSLSSSPPSTLRLRVWLPHMPVSHGRARGHKRPRLTLNLRAFWDMREGGG